MTDVAPAHPPARRTLSRLHAFVLALALILGGVAIARADRPAAATDTSATALIRS